MIERTGTDQGLSNGHHTKGLDHRGTLVDLERDVGLVQKHSKCEASETSSNDKDLGSLRVHDRTVVLEGDGRVDLHGCVLCSDE